MGEIVGSVLGFVGAQQSADAAYDAATQSANAQRDAARMAAEASAFRPVGITNRFGSSNFTMDGNRLTGANYTLSPELKAYQDYLAQQTQAGLGDTSRLLSLGRGYIGEDPQAVRQRYIEQQSSLLAPKQEQTLAGIRNKLFQTGRQGLATGATTAGGLAATNPEMAAYYNSLADSQRQIAAGADAAAQDQITFGQGLLSSAYSPFQTSLGLLGTVEELGRSPFDLGVSLGGRTAQAGSSAANTLLQGGQGAARAMQGAASYSPWGSFLSGLSTNKTATQGIANMFGGNSYGGTPQGAYAQQDQYLAGAFANPQTQQAQMLAKENEWFN